MPIAMEVVGVGAPATLGVPRLSVLTISVLRRAFVSRDHDDTVARFRWLGGILRAVCAIKKQVGVYLGPGVYAPPE